MISTSDGTSRKPRCSLRVMNSPLGMWLVTVALMVLMAPACSKVSVHTQVDPSANFSTYTSFDLLPKGGMDRPPNHVPRHMRVVRDPLFHANVQEALQATLVKKGFTRAHGREDADLVIGYRTVVKDRTDIVAPIYGTTWRGRPYVAQPGHVHWYKEGTLVIDIIDARTKNMVWRGVGVGAMRDMRPGDDLKSAVRAILKDVPPK